MPLPLRKTKTAGIGFEAVEKEPADEPHDSNSELLLSDLHLPLDIRRLSGSSSSNNLESLESRGTIPTRGSQPKRQGPILAAPPPPPPPQKIDTKVVAKNFDTPGEDRSPLIETTRFILPEKSPF
jgi:hypothetical protein